jgi:HIRAN domain
MAMENAVVVVDVEFEERYWYPDDGGQIWLSGYSVVDPESGRFLARDAPDLVARDLHVASVAGAAAHHAEAVAGEDVAPGRPLVLRRDAGNPFDANAIAVHPAGEGEQLGWVPRELAARLAPELDAGREWSAVVLRESRPSPRDPRTGLTMLLAPAGAIELRDRR